MEIGIILKIAGIGFLISVIVQVLNKSGRDEQGLMLIIAGVILVFFILVGLQMPHGASLLAIRTET